MDLSHNDFKGRVLDELASLGDELDWEFFELLYEISTSLTY